MIFSTVWDRYFKNFGGFAMTGLGVFLIMLGSGVVFGIVMMATLMPVMMRMARTMTTIGPKANPAMMGFEYTSQMMSAMLPMFVIMLALGVFIYGFVGSGVMGAVVAHRRGAPVEFGTFWSYGVRYLWRMTGLSALYTVTAVALSLMIYVPLARTFLAAFFSGRFGAAFTMMPIGLLIYLVLMLAMAVLMTNTVIYPAYLIVNDEKGVMEAYGAGWRLITGNFGEAMVSGLVMALFFLVIYVAALINIIPLLGMLAYLAFLVFMLPFIALYFSERFEQRIRPTL